MTEKDKVIRNIYYDSEQGFGSVADTYKQAKKVLNTITQDDVKQFLGRQKIRQYKKSRGFNSYVADGPLQEIQIDLAIFTDSADDNDGYKYCMVGVDVFTKHLWGVPLKSKNGRSSQRFEGYIEQDWYTKDYLPRQRTSMEFTRVFTGAKFSKDKTDYHHLSGAICGEGYRND